MSLEEKLDKIRSQPKLQSQQQTAVVLSAVEDTLRTQTPPSPTTPTAYFAALLSLLPAQLPQNGSIPNKEVAAAVVYLLDLVTPFVSAPLLRAKFTQILTSLAPALTHPEAEAPLLRAAIGILESLLVVQNAEAWALPASGISPRRAVAGLLGIAVDGRPKVRKRASEALVKVLQAPPPSPSLDHPAADMCAETALRSLKETVEGARSAKKKNKDGQENQSELIHTLQLVKTIATASGGWPSKKMDALCELLLSISRSNNEYLTVAAFEIFEVIFGSMADEVSSAKLPRLLEVIVELQPSKNDSQLLPPWVAVISRGYDVAAQIQPDETFLKLPELFELISRFLSSSSHNIRISASECLISFLANCIPDNVILEPSVYDKKILEKLAKIVNGLLSVKYQGAWMEVFAVVAAMFESLKWRSAPLLSNVVKTVGDLRGNDSFTGKKEADAVLSKAIHAMGPDEVLTILPLNLTRPVPGQQGRAWLLPLLRDSISSTRLGHFKEEMVPLSEAMFQRVLDHQGEKTMEVKIYETIVAQVWSTLPGYCDLPLDLIESFDQSFAELLSNLLYQQTELRTNICRALMNLVESNRAISTADEDEDLALHSRVSKQQAEKNLEYLAGFAANLLAVLFNVYSQTLPNYRGVILQCINAYLSITPEQELNDTFTRVASMLESSLAESAAQIQAEKQKHPKDKMPPTSHTLMDLIITLSIYLPRSSFPPLFTIAALVINRDDDAQLQKKAYKLIPRLAESEQGRQALEDRSPELQKLLLDAAEKASAPSRRDRLVAISGLIPSLPASDLSFIPCILSEVVIAAKEVNEKARTAAFDLLVQMGEKMAAGGTIVSANVPHLGPSIPNMNASLEEFFTMVSAGLVGTTPHMVSASITALSRLFFQFHDQLSEAVVVDLVQTMDLFLTSKNREMVRSVLGFVKVCILSLPTEMVKPRLETLIPNLMVWSHEHKAHFRAKVKHIIERLVRRFGVEIVEKYCPEEDKKLITNIRKTRDRKKRKKADGDNEDEEDKPERKGQFESEFDRAVYSSDEESGSDDEEERELGAKRGKKKSQTYIVEDDDEPLDLLSRNALGNISSTKPLPRAKQQPQKRKAKVDLDGKLILKDSSDEEDDDGDIEMDGTDLTSGINAYVDAIRGADVARRGAKGKLKFKNSRAGKRDDGDDDEMDVDDVKEVGKKIKGQLKESNGNRGGFRGRGGFKANRRGLGVQKGHGGRVDKRGGGKFRGRR